MDFDVRPYNFTSATTSWLTLLGILAVVCLALPLVVLAGRGGASGLVEFRRGLWSYLEDVFSLSFRRILALTSLTLKEAVRRKALLVFVLFAVLLMFAGWFMTDSNERAELQVSVHVTFLLTAISWLLLPALIFLSCWALPDDIRIRSLQASPFERDHRCNRFHLQKGGHTGCNSGSVRAATSATQAISLECLTCAGAQARSRAVWVVLI